MNSETPTRVRCQRCGAEMEAGWGTAIGLMGSMTSTSEPQLVLIVPGEPTAANPIRAFKQGLEETPDSRAYLLRGHRCSACGKVELSATEETDWRP